MSSSVASRAEWQKRVTALVPSLSSSQAKVLGLISYGIVLFDGCGMTRLSNGLGKVEQVPAERLRQRLREFYYEASAKRGKKRREVDVRACFGDLLAGILRDWHGEKTLALALDASTLGERFTVLNLSVLYRGCALPVAWVIIRAKQQGSWRPYWEGLLAAVASVVPPDWKVIVTADQGLYADWLWTAIQNLGWHPLLRIRLQMGFRAEGEADFAALGKRVQRRGRGWKGKGEWSEKGARLQGTLLVRWEKGYEEAMAVVTDLPEEQVEIAWYLMRFWIEDEYKDHKRGGWGWQHTKMEDPKRAERLWLAMAVAMHMAVLVGGLEEAKEEVQSRKRRPAKPFKRVGRPAKPLHKPRRREQSCLVRGQQRIRAAVVRTETLPQGYVVSEPWPTQTYRPTKRTGKWGGKNTKREANRSYKQRRRARGDEADKRKDRERVQEQRKRQQQAQRATKANRKAERQKEQEAERKRLQQEQAARRIQRREQRQEEQAHKREARVRAREERKQIREERRLWHEEMQRERVARQLRQAERAARRSSLTLGSPSASSKKGPLQHALVEPLEPP